MQAKRAPWTLYIITLAGLILGGRMAWDGLYACITGQIFPSAGVVGASRNMLGRLLSYPLTGMLGLGAAELGWYYLVLGLSWIGALTALWIQQHWGWVICLGIALLSITYAGPGGVVSILIAILLFIPITRTWVEP